jgi:hypothetical protein
MNKYCLCIQARTVTQYGGEGGTYTYRQEMLKNAVSVLGVSEVRWKGQGYIRSGDYAVYYSGGESVE